jgi:uncharacterized membrane protein (UPF0182 family)
VETAAYPELRLVVLMHGDNLSYAETFEDALEGLFDAGRALPALLPDGASSLAEQARSANEAFGSYLRLQGEGRFSEAGAELERLRTLLERLAEAAEGAEGR